MVLNNSSFYLFSSLSLGFSSKGFLSIFLGETMTKITCAYIMSFVSSRINLKRVRPYFVLGVQMINQEAWYIGSSI